MQKSGKIGLVFFITRRFKKLKIQFYFPTAPRPEWSSFCGAKRSKKAGTEGGNVRQKKISETINFQLLNVEKSASFFLNL